MKVLYVAFSDAWSAAQESIVTGKVPPIRKRVVRVPLTLEQAMDVMPRVVGRSGNKAIYEDIELLCLQSEPEATQ